uniref:Uncharacterized protein n=1 Tax=Sus scrofa TaxID=9823 RepID=A0A8W4FM42_PIG
MAKVSKKLATPSTLTEQLTSSSKPRKKRQAACQLQSRGSNKKTARVKRPLQGSSRRKTSPKPATPSTKPKKARGLTLFGHYHRLNETMNQNQEPDQKNPTSVKVTDNIPKKRIVFGGCKPNTDLGPL